MPSSTKSGRRLLLVIALAASSSNNNMRKHKHRKRQTRSAAAGLAELIIIMIIMIVRGDNNSYRRCRWYAQMRLEGPGDFVETSFHVRWISIVTRTGFARELHDSDKLLRGRRCRCGCRRHRVGARINVGLRFQRGNREMSRPSVQYQW